MKLTKADMFKKIEKLESDLSSERRESNEFKRLYHESQLRNEKLGSVIKDWEQSHELLDEAGEYFASEKGLVNNNNVLCRPKERSDSLSNRLAFYIGKNYKPIPNQPHD